MKRTEPAAPEGVAGGHDIVVIGASAGGIEALLRLIARLPEDLPASIFIVVHTSPQSPGFLSTMVGGVTALSAATVEDGEPITHGRIYLASPDRHLMLERDRVRSIRAAKENLARPAINPLFRSAAAAFGPRTIGVLLSGYLDDGVAGLAVVKRCGGVTMVQTPRDAVAPSIPSAALASMAIDFQGPAERLGDLINNLARTPVQSAAGALEARLSGDADPGIARLREEVQEFMNDGAANNDADERTSLSCPECGGPITFTRDGEVPMYRCYMGHAFSRQAMNEGEGQAIEKALSTATRIMRERASVLEQMANDSENGLEMLQATYLSRAEELRHHSHVVDQVIQELDAK